MAKKKAKVSKKKKQTKRGINVVNVYATKTLLEEQKKSVRILYKNKRYGTLHMLFKEMSKHFMFAIHEKRENAAPIFAFIDEMSGRGYISVRIDVLVKEFLKLKFRD